LAHAGIARRIRGAAQDDRDDVPVVAANRADQLYPEASV
jgi:hypothetical protein